jgi:hypothetical protein
VRSRQRPADRVDLVQGGQEAAALIDQLRASATILTYDPDTRTIHVGEDGLIAVTAG